YRHIGRSAVAKQQTSARGNAMIAHLDDDLQKASPARVWVLADPRLPHTGPVPRLLRAEKLVPQGVGQISESGLPLAVAESPAVRTSFARAAAGPPRSGCPFLIGVIIRSPSACDGCAR